MFGIGEVGEVVTGEVVAGVPQVVVEGAAVAAQDGALVADLGDDDRAGDREGALGVVGAAELSAAKTDVLGDQGGAEAEEAAGAGVVGDGDARGEEVLEALLGDLRGAVDGDVGDVLEEDAGRLLVARTEEQGVAVLADVGAGRGDVDDRAVVTAREDPPDVEVPEGALLGSQGVVLVGEADAVQGAADALGAVLQRFGGDDLEAHAAGLADDVLEEAPQSVRPRDDGVGAVLAVEEAALMAGEAGVPQQGHVKAELGDVGGPGAVGEVVVPPLVAVGLRRRAALGLDGDDLVAGELDEVEPAVDPPGGGAELHAPREKCVPREGFGGAFAGGVRGGAGAPLHEAAPGGPLVLAAALNGLG